MTSRLLSSRLTPVYRWVLPLVLTLAAVGAIWQIGGIGKPGPVDPVSLLFSFSLAIILLIYARILDRGKQVWLEGRTLVIKDYLRKQTRVELSEVQRISTEAYWRPTRIRVIFSRPTIFGDRIVFFPPASGIRFRKPHPLALELNALCAVPDASSGGKD